MITHYFRTLRDTELKTYDEPRAGVWTHVSEPSQEELSEIIETYKLDETVVSDIADFFEVPRFEHIGSALYFFTRYPFDERAEDIDTAPILLVTGESFVITVVQRRAPFLERFIEGRQEIHTTQKTKLFLEFMTALTSAYERELTRMRRAVYRDRTRLRNISGKDIQRLVSYEHALNDTISAMVPTNDWLKQLAKGNHIQLFKEDMEFMDDLMIANSQLIESAKSVLKTIQNIRNASEAILTQNLNNTIKLLTALTVILTIPTLVSSLYGMNVALPLSQHPYAFWLVLVLIVTVMTLVSYYFIRKQWF